MRVSSSYLMILKGKKVRTFSKVGIKNGSIMLNQLLGGAVKKLQGSPSLHKTSPRQHARGHFISFCMRFSLALNGRQYSPPGSAGPSRSLGTPGRRWCLRCRRQLPDAAGRFPVCTRWSGEPPPRAVPHPLTHPG